MQPPAPEISTYPERRKEREGKRGEGEEGRGIEEEVAAPRTISLSSEKCE